MRFTAKFILPALLLLALQACSTPTKLVTRWHDTGYQGPPLGKVLVIGVFRDDLMRRMFEDEFVRELEGMGEKGIASYVYMPDLKTADDQKKLEAVVRKTGVDGVLITTLKSLDKEQTRMPPRTDWVPAGYGGRGYYGYYYQTMVPVTTPGYVRTDTIARLETRAFAVDAGKLVWAANIESFNPDSPARAVREIARLVVKDMKDAGLLK